MGTRLAPWTARIWEVLADGQWHRFEELLAEAGPLIPPGRAMRKRERAAESQRRNYREAGHPEGPRKARSADYIVAIGRRMIIRDATCSPAFERHRIDGMQWVRLRPDS